MSADGPDWIDTIQLGEGSRVSRKRQLIFAGAILIVSIAVLIGLVVAGSALFRVVSDRAHHTTRSYDYGKARAPHTAQARNASDADRHELCRLLLTSDSQPGWLDLGEAIDGCADAAAR